MMHEISTQTKEKKASVVVIIPYYNGSKFIERAVRSVVDQTVPADELIIVNDGSTPEESNSLHQLSQQYNFKIIDKGNGGQGSARNAGVSKTVSDYICFLDQDDFFLDQHIEILLSSIPAHTRRFGYVYADIHICDGEGNLVFTSAVKENSYPNPKRSILDLVRHDMFVLPSATLINRAAFQAVGGFDEQFTGYEDDDLFLRMFRSGYSNIYVDMPVTAWCINSESTSYSIKMARSRMRYIKKLIAIFPDTPGKTPYFLGDRSVMRHCIIPRFNRLLVLDAYMAVRDNSPNRNELNTILKEYKEMVVAAPSVSFLHKVFLQLVCFLLNNCPVFFIRLCGKFVSISQLHRILLPLGLRNRD